MVFLHRQKDFSVAQQVVQEYTILTRDYTAFRTLIELTFPFFYKESPHYYSSTIIPNENSTPNDSTENPPPGYEPTISPSDQPERINVTIIDLWRTKQDYYSFRTRNRRRLSLLEGKLEQLVLQIPRN